MTPWEMRQYELANKAYSQNVISTPESKGGQLLPSDGLVGNVDLENARAKMIARQLENNQTVGNYLEGMYGQMRKSSGANGPESLRGYPNSEFEEGYNQTALARNMQATLPFFPKQSGNNNYYWEQVFPQLREYIAKIRSMTPVDKYNEYKQYYDQPFSKSLKLDKQRLDFLEEILGNKNTAY